MLLPWPRPLTLLVATFGWRMVAELSVLQLPVPTTGTVAPNWALLLQTSMLEPTCAADGLSLTMSTKSTAVQPALLTVHWKVLRPSWRFVKPQLEAFTSLNEAEPVARLHVPVSPAFNTEPRVALVLHTLLSAPALVTKLLLETDTELDALHEPWVTVQVKLFEPLARLLTLLFADERLVMADVPAVLHTPVP